MDKNKQITIGLIALAAILGLTLYATGGFSKLFGGGSEGSQIRTSASSALPPGTTNLPGGQGNIPGTNTNETPVPDGPTTSIKYDTPVYDYGVVDEGEIVKYVFKFTNVGHEPLTISNCRASCGCTVPKWPKEPIAPGARGEIAVEFNTKGKPGRQSKRVTVTANTNPTETFIEVVGEVRSKEQPATKG
ncbi:MAG: DUF1573 domain-containing protein [Saprospiraceae bacterium]